MSDPAGCGDHNQGSDSSLPLIQFLYISPPDSRMQSTFGTLPTTGVNFSQQADDEDLVMSDDTTDTTALTTRQNPPVTPDPRLTATRQNHSVTSYATSSATDQDYDMIGDSTSSATGQNHGITGYATSSAKDQDQDYDMIGNSTSSATGQDHHMSDTATSLAAGQNQQVNVTATLPANQNPHTTFIHATSSSTLPKTTENSQAMMIDTTPSATQQGQQAKAPAIFFATQNPYATTVHATSSTLSTAESSQAMINSATSTATQQKQQASVHTTFSATRSPHATLVHASSDTLPPKTEHLQAMMNDAVSLANRRGQQASAPTIFPATQTSYATAAHATSSTLSTPESSQAMINSATSLATQQKQQASIPAMFSATQNAHATTVHATSTTLSTPENSQAMLNTATSPSTQQQQTSVTAATLPVIEHSDAKVLDATLSSSQQAQTLSGAGQDYVTNFDSTLAVTEEESTTSMNVTSSVNKQTQPTEDELADIIAAQMEFLDNDSTPPPPGDFEHLEGDSSEPEPDAIKALADHILKYAAGEDSDDSSELSDCRSIMTEEAFRHEFEQAWGEIEAEKAADKFIEEKIIPTEKQRAEIQARKRKVPKGRRNRMPISGISSQMATFEFDSKQQRPDPNTAIFSSEFTNQYDSPPKDESQASLPQTQGPLTIVFANTKTISSDEHPVPMDTEAQSAKPEDSERKESNEDAEIKNIQTQIYELTPPTSESKAPSFNPAPLPETSPIHIASHSNPAYVPPSPFGTAPIPAKSPAAPYNPASSYGTASLYTPTASHTASLFYVEPQHRRPLTTTEQAAVNSLSFMQLSHLKERFRGEISMELRKLHLEEFLRQNRQDLKAELLKELKTKHEADKGETRELSQRMHNVEIKMLHEQHERAMGNVQEEHKKEVEKQKKFVVDNYNRELEKRRKKFNEQFKNELEKQRQTDSEQHKLELERQRQTISEQHKNEVLQQQESMLATLRTREEQAYSQGLMDAAAEHAQKWSMMDQDLANQRAKLDSDMAELRRQRAEAEGSMQIDTVEALQSEIIKHNEQLSNLTEEASAVIDRLQRSNHVLLEKNELLEKDMEINRGDLSKAQDELREAKLNSNKSSRVIEAQDKEATGLNATIASLQEEATKAAAAFKTKANAAKGLLEEVATVKKERDLASENLAKESQARQRAEADKKILAEVNTALRAEIAVLETRPETVELEAATQQYELLSLQFEQILDEHQEARKLGGEQEAQIKGLTSELGALRRRLQTNAEGFSLNPEAFPILSLPPRRRPAVEKHALGAIQHYNDVTTMLERRELFELERDSFILGMKNGQKEEEERKARMKTWKEEEKWVVVVPAVEKEKEEEEEEEKWVVVVPAEEGRVGARVALGWKWLLLLFFFFLFVLWGGAVLGAAIQERESWLSGDEMVARAAITLRAGGDSPWFWEDPLSDSSTGF